jgi:hypothetical protein
MTEAALLISAGEITIYTRAVSESKVWLGKVADGLRFAPPILRIFSWFQGVPERQE